MDEIKYRIEKLINKLSLTEYKEELYNSLLDYYKLLGYNDFLKTYELFLVETLPNISLICIGVNDDYIREFLVNQIYKNIEVVILDENEGICDALEYIKSCGSKYICFLENDYVYNKSYLLQLLMYAENNDKADLCIAKRLIIEENGEIIGNSGILYSNAQVYNLNDVISESIEQSVNLLGTLSCCMIKTQYIKNVFSEKCRKSLGCMTNFQFLINICENAKGSFLNNELIKKIVRKKTGNLYLYEKKYYEVIASKFGKKTNSNIINCKKEITFFYTDKGEYYNLKPIADEARKRGYEILFTENLKQKAEIGIYCQHVCFPENSKFSLILLHDMAQGHLRWPNIWEGEQWNKFDIGILPGKDWTDRWKKCGCFSYANPRNGVFELGYPKSDLIKSDEINKRANELIDLMKIRSDKPNVLYAPSWENDGKEDEFIKALYTLNVNLIIKQAHWDKSYQHIIDNINDMRRLHDGKYENVYYIDPEESIMVALKMCDLIVSDESSVMVEGLLYGKPSIAVTDWLVPDVTPSRYAEMPLDCVVKCKNAELREQVERIINDKKYYEEVVNRGNGIFSNIGNSCKDIVDAIDYYLFLGEEKGFLSKKVYCDLEEQGLWN